MESLKINNFMAFSEEVNVKFSPKINVIIGENGTGKSQLLKLVHFCHGSISTLWKSEITGAEQGLEILTDEFLKYFLPLDNELGQLCHFGATEHSELEIVKQHNFSISFQNTSQKLSFKGTIDKFPFSTFIPAKEVLSSMEGFVSMYDKYVVSFDKTYNDICLDLDHPVLRPEKLREKSKQSIDKIEELCGGKFIFHGGGKITFKTFEDNELSVNAMAEGYRKIGMLARLLKTGAINSDTSGPLLWDEPEANMNPKIMKLLVEILLELSRNGQQIILTTHDYVLLKWFDLLMDKDKDDEVRYFTLHKEGGIIKVAPTNEYMEISPNPIDDAYDSIINVEIGKEMGDFGK